MFFIISDSTFIFNNSKEKRKFSNLVFTNEEETFEIRANEGKDVRVRFIVTKIDETERKGYRKKFRKYTHSIDYNAIDNFTGDKASVVYWCYEIDSIPISLIDDIK